MADSLFKCVLRETTQSHTMSAHACETVFVNASFVLFGSPTTRLRAPNKFCERFPITMRISTKELAVFGSQSAVMSFV